MASIHRQPGRPYWFCAFSIFNPETRTSRRVFRSTKTRDKKQALEMCRTWHKAALKARNSKLSVDAAREVIAQGVSDVFTAASTKSLPNASIKSWCDTWLQSKSIEAEQSTHARYGRIIERFIDSTGVKAKRDLSTLQTTDIAQFRVCFGEAVRESLLGVNPGCVYIGQRFGDLARLTWRAIDLDSGEIAFTTRKTGGRIVLPLVQPLIDYL